MLSYLLKRYKYYLICFYLSATLKQLYEKEYSGDDKIIIEWRNRLNNLPPTEKNVKKNPNYIVTIYNEILNYIIEHNLEPKNKAIRLFSILPHKNSFTISNITIDKSVLKDIISSFKKDECEGLFIDAPSTVKLVTTGAGGVVCVVLFLQLQKIIPINVMKTILLKKFILSKGKS